jgi:4-carboxymuconolactone decarboxylase
MTGDVNSRAQAYIDEMARTRGYVLDYHKTLARADFPVLEAANGLVNAAYLDQRLLDRRTKELLFVLSLTVLRAPQAQIRAHIMVALEIGVTPPEILEALEIALPEAGIVAFQHGFDVWCECVDAPKLEPGDKAGGSSAGRPAVG